MNSGEGIGTGQAVTTGKVRVYELAKELGVPNKDLVTKIRALGIEAKNHMSNLEVDDVMRIKRALDKERQENLVEERITATVIRRRTKDGTAVRPLAAPPATTAAPERRRVVVTPGPSASPPATERLAPPPVEVREPQRVPVREVPAPEAPAMAKAGMPGTASPPPSAASAAPEHVPVSEARPLSQEMEEQEAAPPAMHELPEEPAPAVVAPEVEAPAPQERHEAPAEAARMREEAPSAPVVEKTPVSPPVTPPAEEPAQAATQAPATPPAAPEVPEAAPPQAAEPARPRETPAPEVSREAAEAPPIVSVPKKPEPVKTGPTGRVIELPHMRQPIIQVTEKPAAARPGFRTGRPEGGEDRSRFARQQPGKKKPQIGKKQKQTQITTPAAHKRVIKMEETIGVSELAKQMGTKATDVLKKLWGMGMTGINLNSAIDQDAAGLVSAEFGYEIENVAFQEAQVFAEQADRPEDLQTRAPVVTIMGHVDHGKTSLLDAIRNANVAAGEAGGITQHIGAYKVSAPSGDVVFLDTPGHEAFTAMRARGAQATDIVVLVVAADDGVMPTTVEALNHAKAAEVSIIVAVNKIDKPTAQPDRIRQQLSEHGLVPEQWGGETIYVDVSARTKVGIDQLLEMLALQAEVLELKANPKKLAKGVIIEGKLDRNRGPVATMLVQDGTLKVGDTITAGEQMGKVRAMLDDKGRNVTSAGPATPVEVLGLSGVPGAGETFNSVTDEKAAKELVEHRRDARRKKEMAGTSRVSLENILERIREGSVKELKIVLKADVQGSSEALKDALMNLSTERVKVDVISSGVGGITETDVNLAKAGNAIIVGFHVRPAGKAGQLAEQEGVDIKIYEIIYEALDDVKKAMAGLLAPVQREKALGKAEVRQTFNIPKIGAIAGCSVIEGTIKRSAQVRLVRDSVQIYQGRISSLRRFKDDVREVAQGYECGIGIENYNDLKSGDIIEAFEIEEIAPTL
ncbi:MAG TPA: translation initiation factor IF-2 [Polyangia bacterium]|jgi:translation initiation factor IF-2|nr:translation initiation factor IF-2 [Polyangia bacterium]